MPFGNFPQNRYGIDNEKVVLKRKLYIHYTYMGFLYVLIRSKFFDSRVYKSSFMNSEVVYISWYIVCV